METMPPIRVAHINHSRPPILHRDIIPTLPIQDREKAMDINNLNPWLILLKAISMLLLRNIRITRFLNPDTLKRCHPIPMLIRAAIQVREIQA
jgi:hypothetical protein